MWSRATPRALDPNPWVGSAVTTTTTVPIVSPATRQARTPSPRRSSPVTAYHLTENPPKLLQGSGTLIDTCLAQDERFLRYDAAVAEVPIGNYTPQPKAFRLTGSHDALHCAAVNLPPKLHQLLAANEGSKAGILPTLEAFWVSQGDELHLMNWAGTGTPLKLSFENTVVAVGITEVKPGLKLPSEVTKQQQRKGFVMQQLLLVATTLQLSLWLICKVEDSFETVALPHRIGDLSCTITCITGHCSSGRLFLGDSGGSVYEFVFISNSTTDESWKSLLFGFAGGTSAESPTKQVSPTKHQHRTNLHKISGPSSLTRIIPPWGNSKRAISFLSVDEDRGLIWAVDGQSNIQLFHVPPPDIIESRVIEKQPMKVAALSRQEVINHLQSIYRQVLRATKPVDAGLLPQRSTIGLKLIQQTRVGQVFPLSRDEGDRVIAVAITSTGGRLFLRTRSDLPLVLPKLDLSNDPSVRAHQYIRSIDVLNWKPPPNVRAHLATVRGVARPTNNDEPPEISAALVSSRLFLAAFDMDHTALACVMPDEAVIMRKQARVTEGDTAKELREWLHVLPSICGCRSDVGKLRIYGISEVPNPAAYKSMLEYRGVLPHPHNAVGRAAAAKAAQFRTLSQRCTVGPDVQQSPLATPPSIVGRASRLSPSPWDVPPRPLKATNAPDGVVAVTSAYNAPNYVPPCALHSLTATQTLPARVFVILCSHGVVFVQQNRLMDLMLESADEVLRTPPGATAAATPLSIQKYLATTTGAKVADLFRIGPPVENRETATFLHFHLLAQLFSSESVMSAAWHALVFHSSRVTWPALTTMRKPEKALTATSVGLMATTSTRGHQPIILEDDDAMLSSGMSPTPKVRKAELPHASFNFDRSEPLTNSTPFAVDGLDELPTLLTTGLSTKHRDACEFLLEVLLRALTDPGLNTDPLFSDCSSGGVPLDGLPAGGLLTARVKGAALFLSRILRPFWRVPVLEACALEATKNKSLEDLLLGTVVVVYRRATPGAGSAGIWDSAAARQNPSRGKRSAGRSPSPRGKKQKTPEGNVIPTQERSPPLDRIALALTSRFSAVEIAKAVNWLEKFADVANKVAEMIKSNNSVVLSLALDERFPQANRFAAEAEQLTRLAAMALLSSQALLLCSVLAEPLSTGSRELPPALFDALAEASLHDMLCSDRHKDALRHTSLLHIVPSAFLAENCRSLFSECDLKFQRVLEPLQWTHEANYGQRWRRVRFAECQPIPRDVVLQPAVQTAVEELLALASRGTPPTGHRLRAIAALLAELQLYPVLAEFLALLAEKTITAQPIGTTMPGNVTSYLQNPVFRQCLREYFEHLEDLLAHYKRVDEVENNSGTGRNAGQRLVEACLGLPLQLCTDGLTPADSLATAVCWLQFVVLDWIAEVGDQKFPIALSDCRTPAFLAWIQTQQGSIREQTLEVLCSMFANSHDYDKLSTFLVSVAFQAWADPTQYLAENAIIPNGVAVASAVPPALCRDFLSGACVLNLTAYVAQVAAGFGFNSSPEDVKLIQPLWDRTREFVDATRGGLSLHERHALLVQGMAALQDPLRERGKEHLIPAFARVARGLAMCEIQAALLRETADLCCWLMVQLGSRGMDAFSPDVELRRKTFDDIRTTDRKSYVHLQNVQALLYMLQWKLYDSPVQLLDLIVNFEEASQCLLPYPGLALLEPPRIRLDGLRPELRAAVTVAAPMNLCGPLPRQNFIETARARREDLINALSK